MASATKLVSLLSVVVAAGCASSGASSSAAPPVTVTPVTQRVVAAGTTVNINTVSVNAGFSQLIVAPIDAAWTALNVTYNELGIPIRTLVDAQRLIGNDSFKTRRRIGKVAMQNLLDCGNAQGIPNAETYDIMMSISSTLVPNPKGGVNLNTRIDATGKSPNFSREASVMCSSTGGLEKMIADLVRAKTAK